MIGKYLELTGDMEFAIYSTAMGFGLILLVGLLGKLAGGKPADAKKPVEPKSAPAKAEAPKKEKGSMYVLPETTVLEGADTKPSAAHKPEPVPSGPVTPPPKPPKESPRSEVASAVEKTVILPPRESLGAGPARSNPPVPTPPAATEKWGEAQVKILSDLQQMLEALVRRISAMEADMKRDPLYLDPLMKRMGVLEKRIEELAVKAVPPAPVESDGNQRGGDVKELQEKILRFEKILTELSGGPVTGSLSAAPKQP